MAGQAPVTVRNQGFLPPRRKAVTPETGDALHSRPMDHAVLMTAQARVLDRHERVRLAAVTIPAHDLLQDDMASMAY